MQDSTDLLHDITKSKICYLASENLVLAKLKFCFEKFDMQAMQFVISKIYYLSAFFHVLFTPVGELKKARPADEFST